MIKEICHEITEARAGAIEAIFEDTCAEYGITLKNDKAAFLAQICHESGEFTIKTENMNYTTPQRIVDIWPSRFSMTGSNGVHGKLNAHDFTHNPEKLADVVYANRMGNGSPASGDGFKYRGGGFLQLTGKESYAKYAAYKGLEIADAANKVHTDDAFAMDSAAWEYVVDKKLLGETDFVLITQRINGGTIGLAERRKYYNRALEIIT
jgi:putative chitinase